MHRENVNPPAWHATGRTVRARFLLLILDPELEGIRAFAAALEDRQIDVVLLDDPATALIQAGAILPDAILTAAQVPPMRGSDIARVVTAYGGIPVLVGVGEHDGVEASLALANGARVCVPRPYRVVDVLPMLRAISPDTVADFHVTVEVGGLRLDPAAVEVQHRGRRISLPMREFQLLHLLMLHAGRVVTHTQINQLVWAKESEESSNTLAVHIRRLRTRLGDDLKDPKIIVSVRGIGYRLNAPARQPSS